MSARPRSAASFPVSVAVLAAGLALTVAVAMWRDAPFAVFTAYAPMAPCLAVFTLLAAAEWLMRRRGRLAGSEIAPAPRRAVEYPRVGLRIVGLAATLALVGLAYWLFPEYHGGFYDPYWHFLSALAPLLVFVPFYFVWADSRVLEPRDEFVQFAQLLLGRRAEVDGAVIRRHLLGWTVKGFFLPLMTVYLNDECNELHRLYLNGGMIAFAGFNGLFHLSYVTDLLFCVVGYTATMRLLDSHMRSVEPTMLGWVSALVCYQPFYSIIGRYYLQYDGDLPWSRWLAPWPLLRDGWGIAILVLSAIYALSTVAFGLRFSNLTHRGIITGGPYRFTKHPAYLSKNLSWWLISVPFVVGTDWPTALRHSVLLLLLNTVYFVRARTEERHLSRDPAYVAYAQWINEHGLLRELGNIVPALRYREPAPAPAAAPTSGARRA
ncbi:MAG TPA: isoprenylcysteine carboxylmethyltransferase family protein [Steroidobacteraceae bacterium]|nr:isoprenylcysteine carboxylmethyltransferase family protein [Steroidobacteraceae bacterium]